MSLAAATHVLLIPNQGHSYCPTVASAEVLWALPLNGRAIQATQCRSTRSCFLFFYHIDYLFLPMIKQSRLQSWSCWRLNNEGTMCFEHSLQNTQSHTLLVFTLMREMLLHVCRVHTETGQCELLFFCCRKSRLKKNKVCEVLSNSFCTETYICLTLFQARLACKPFLSQRCVLFRPPLIAVFLACRISLSLSLCNY